MTKIRRAAQLINDLKTLGVVEENMVKCLPSLRNGVSLLINISKEDHNNYLLVKEAFEQEFTSEVEYIEDSSFLQFILPY